MIKKILYILEKKERRQIPVLLIEILLGSVLESAGISAVLPVVNILVDPDVIHREGLLGKLYSFFDFRSPSFFIVALMLFVIAFYVLKNLFLILTRYHQYSFINKGQCSLTKRLMSGYYSQPYSYFTKRNIADLQRNVTADVGKCYQTLLSILFMLSQFTISVALLVFLLATDFITTIVVFVLVIVVTLLFIKLTQARLNRYGKEAREKGAQVIQWINQGFSGVKEIKLLNKEKYFISQIDKAYSVSAKMERNSNVISTLPAPVMETLSIAVLLIAIIVHILLGGDLKNFVTTLVAFALAAIRIVPNISGFSSRLNMITFNKSSINGICSELEALEKNNANDFAIYETIAEKLTFKNEICIKDITFCYDDSEEATLENISLNIKRGTSVAFVGPSGAGKTTLADVIIGILKPKRGSVSVDGKNIEQNISGWYKQIGYIPQSIYLMDTSIRENIAFGIDKKLIDDEKVWLAIKKAQLEDFVRSLPNGLDTNLGDRGLRCSGGQRQRIGIARALYEDPAFLVLDEATSALDTETEKAIMEAIDSLKGQKTLLIIAHRLSTIKNCDVVYRVQDKTVVQER